MGRRKKSNLPKSRMSICEFCSRCTPIDCAYIWERNPVMGLALMGITDVEIKTLKDIQKRTYFVYKVRRCPSFKRGPIPPVDWERLAERVNGAV